MTWRERVARARDRQYFGGDDYVAWVSVETCPAGEAIKAATGVPTVTKCFLRYKAAFDLGERMHLYMDAGLFGRADDLIDQIEDTVLTIKREETK